MANVNVSYSDLEYAASRLAAIKESLQAGHADARSQLAELVASGFVTDTASGFFAEAQQQYLSGSASTLDALERLVQGLRNVAQTFQQTDSALAQALGDDA